MPTNLSNTPPENNLTPQSGSSHLPVKNQSILRLKGARAVIASAAAALSTQISQFFNLGIRILEKLDLADFTGTTFVEWLRWLLSPKGAQALFVLFLTLFFIAVYRTVNSKERTQQPTEGIEYIPAAEVENLEGRIKEQAEEIARLEDARKSDAREIEHFRRQAEKSQESAETHSIRANLNQSLLDKYKWLHEIADEDKKDIEKAVFVISRDVRYNLADPIPTIYFNFAAFNGSFYNLSLDRSIDDEIRLHKRSLMGAMKLDVFKNLAHGDTGDFTLIFQPTPAEAKFIIDEQKKGEDSFYFGHLMIKVKGGDDFPQVGAKRLSLPEYVSGTDAKERVRMLKAQYEAEISELMRRADIVEKLTYVLGMAQQASIRLRESMPKGALLHLNDIISQMLWKCFNNQQVVDDYYRGEPPIGISVPDSTDEQKRWVDLNYDKLSKLIDAQRRK